MYPEVRKRECMAGAGVPSLDFEFTFLFILEIEWEPTRHAGHIFLLTGFN